MSMHFGSSTAGPRLRMQTDELPSVLVPLGRVLFAAIFILSSFGHFSAATIGYAAQQHVPYAQVLVPLSGIVSLIGGLSILLGYHARVGAWLIVLFLVLVAPAMHDFWNVADPMMRAMQMANFLKNLALIGGALLIAYYGAGPISLDAPRRR